MTQIDDDTRRRAERARRVGPTGSGRICPTIVPWTVALLATGCSVVTIDAKGSRTRDPSMIRVSPISAEHFSKRLGNRTREELAVQKNGSGTLFVPLGRSRQTSIGSALGAREIMFPPTGQHTALVHCSSVSAALFMIDVGRK